MLKKFLIVISIFMFCLVGCNRDYISKDNIDEVINPKTIKQHLTFLASDSLKGRNTPSPELNVAADYIAKEFKNYGLSEIHGSYFQSVPMGKISLGEKNSLTITKECEDISFKIKDDFIPFEMTANKEVNSSLVFAGYGIDAPEYDYNDFKSIDVKNKIAIILRDLPWTSDTSSKFNGIQASKYSSILNKVRTAIKFGAAGVIICPGPAKHSFLMPVGFPWPSLSKIIPKDALPLSLLLDEKNKVPVVEVGEKFINTVFGSIENLKKIQRQIDKTYKPDSYDFAGIDAKIITETIIDKKLANNVIGFLEGKDSVLKNEFLVIGAHYDHVGMKKVHSKNEDYIYNGADDNASGTSVLLSIAEAFGNIQAVNKRSILFIAFCGEEKGLFGSRYFVENPLIPLGNIVAMFNLDMVGRNSVDSLMIVGTERNPSLRNIIEMANKESVNFSLNMIPNNMINGSSDHKSFMNKNIPDVFFHSGKENDYHKVSDEASLINYEKATKTAKLVFTSAKIVVNDSSHYKIISQK